MERLQEEGAHDAEKLDLPLQNLAAHVLIVVHRKCDEQGGGVLDVVRGVVRITPKNHLGFNWRLERAPAKHRVIQQQQILIYFHRL